jgi:hypothetical protein
MFRQIFFTIVRFIVLDYLNVVYVQTYIQSHWGVKFVSISNGNNYVLSSVQLGCVPKLFHLNIVADGPGLYPSQEMLGREDIPKAR